MVKIKNQEGIILITVLIFLLILSMLALALLTTSQLQLKMSSNAAQEQIIFQAAEAGLNLAEKQLRDHNSYHDFSDHSFVKLGNLDVVTEFHVLAKNKIICDKSGHHELKLYQINSKSIAPNFYSITLQSVYALPFKPCTAEPILKIKDGRLSWAELKSL